MKIKLLLVSAIAIVGMAVYTLTLSFTNTTPLLSQLEALASGEGGESGGDGSESGNTGGESGEGTEGENPESGQADKKYRPVKKTVTCTVIVIETDYYGNVISTNTKEKTVSLVKECPNGTETATCKIEDCSDI